MKSKIKQVLIIGAGGSFVYKFPLGDQLFKRIKNNFPIHVSQHLAGFTRHYHGNRAFIDASEFSNQIKNITGISIDKYLNLNSDLLELGKKAIAAEIIDCEKQSLNPVFDYVDNDWYTYLFSKMMEGLDSIDDIVENFGKYISIITFNYDRSLENFLFNNLYEILKKKLKKNEIVEIFESIPFIHVYGKTGYLEWESNKDDNLVVPFKNLENVPYVLASKIANMIEIIYEQRKDKDEIQNAKALIEKADRILFLGFGFDTLNLRILGMPDNIENKKIFGTAFQQTENERIHIKNLLKGKSKTGVDINITEFDCLRLLRDHLIV